MIKNLDRAKDLVATFYGAKTSRRGAIPLMNHIDQGLLIMQERGSDEAAQAAFCLHPMVQNDEELSANFEVILSKGFNSKTLAYLFEYRNIANQGLRGATNPDLLNIPLSGVFEMLVADKVQNRYSFEKYHLNTHPHRTELGDYFAAWLKRLQITELQYEHYVSLFDDHK